MQVSEVFTMGLGLQKPWFVTEVKFTPGENPLFGQVDIYIDFERGSIFTGPAGETCTAYDSVPRTWQHLNFFQHKCLVHAHVPRIKTAAGGTEQVPAPWAREGSGFTLMFEAMGMLLVENEMPVNKAAGMMGVRPGRIWRMLRHFVGKALKNENHSGVQRVGVDETSVKKGHKYVTVMACLAQRRVIGVALGKGAESVAQIAKELKNRGFEPEKVTDVSIDLSPAYISAAKAEFPCAEITFDKFHVVKLLGQAMDGLRRNEQREHSALKKTRYYWLKNDENLKPEQIAAREQLALMFPRLGEGYRLKTVFREFWAYKDKSGAEAFLESWCRAAEESGIPSFLDFVKTVKKHWAGILNYVESQVNNGILEGINSKIQLARSRARGYTNMDNFTAIIFLVAGKLNFDYPR